MTESFVPSPQPFDWEDVEFAYAIDDETGSEQRFDKKVTLKVLQPTRFFEHSYNWTGTGTSTDPDVTAVTSRGATLTAVLQGPKIVEDQQYIHLVYFGRRLAAGERVTLTTSQVLIERGRTFQPFLRHSVVHELGSLKLKVKLPVALRVNVRAEIYSVQHDEEIFHEYEVLYDGNETYELHVDEPQVGTRYGIAWL